MSLAFEPVGAMPPADLVDLWARAYEAYFVPLSWDEAQLARHLVRSDIDRELSIVGRVDGEPFGLSMAGVRGRQAWIGGFGIAPEHRRKGLATKLMAQHLDRLRGAGIGEVLLEVININPAREVYRRCGFAETRELLVLIGRAAETEAELAALNPEVIVELETPALAPLDAGWLEVAHARLHPALPTWRRRIETLRHDLAAGAVALCLEGPGGPDGFAVVEPGVGRLSIHDAAAVDREAAALLLGGLAERWPKLDLRLIDEPPGTPLAEAALAAGLKVGLRQVEMAVSL